MSIFDSLNSTHQALENVGYITTLPISNTIYLAAKENKPILLEGPAGGGKTQLARSVASAAGMRMISLQCYEGITDKEVIGDYNQALRDLYVHFQSMKESDGEGWGKVRETLMSREFFVAGPLLEALESEERTVLLIDEIDKISYAFEAMLLEILSIWQLSIPGLGLPIKAKHPPFTVITSNAERELGFALRRRCLFLEVGHPTPEAEARIVANQTPNLPRELHLFIAGLAKSLRDWTMEKPPSISEMNDIAVSLALMGKTEILPEDRDLLMPLFAKTISDRDRLLKKDMFELIVANAKKNAAELRKTQLEGLLADTAIAQSVDEEPEKDGEEVFVA